MKRLALTLLVCLLAYSPTLAAQHFVKLNTSIQPGPLRDTCKSVKGVYSVASDGKSYSCVKNNCDGKGGQCAVACNGYGECTGVTPARLVGPMTLVDILGNGKLRTRTDTKVPESLSTVPLAPSKPAPPASNDGTLY